MKDGHDWGGGEGLGWVRRVKDQTIQRAILTSIMARSRHAENGSMSVPALRKKLALCQKHAVRTVHRRTTE